MFSVRCLPGLLAAATLTLSTASATPLSAAASPMGAVGHWHTVGSLHTPRTNHTATLLQDGRVLVVGGGDGQHVLATAELYDPTTRQWSPTGSLRTPRAVHSATLLPDGRVLVVGGADDTRTFSSVEVYDPASGSWSPAAALPSPRAEQSAFLLANGLVLVLGGTGSRQAGTQLASTQVYDPGAEQWYAAATLNAPRRSLASVLLADGRVLASGGFGNGGVLASNDLLDPSTGDLATRTMPEETGDGYPVDVTETAFTAPWQAVTDMATPREAHTATLLPDGTVLVAGGLQRDAAENAVASAEIYDPTTGAWSGGGTMTMSRAGHSATLLPDGRVLVAGGVSTSCSTGAATCAKKTTELYDPGARAWTAAEDMADWRQNHTATLLADGSVLVVGGRGAHASGVQIAPLATAEVYQP